MSLFQLFKNTFTHPQRLYAAKNKSFPKIFLYLLFLSAILFIPVGVEIVKVVGTVQQDLKAIANQLPEFNVTDNQLSTNEKKSGFIYQTDYLIFTFDPDGKRQASDIHNDLIGNIIGLGLLKDEFIFTVTDDNLLASVIPTTLMQIPYKKIDSRLLNKASLTNLAQSSSNVSRLIGLSFFIAFLPIVFDFILTIIMISLMANIFVRMRHGILRFSETFKIVTLSATVPVILTTILMALIPNFNANFILMALTFFIYIRAIKPSLPDIGAKP